jgi:hypothetical protein
MPIEFPSLVILCIPDGGDKSGAIRLTVICAISQQLDQSAV